MADLIKCSVCGTDNPPNQKLCRKCQSPLSASAITPGQAPTPQDTGKLEPVLPQWLKDAQNAARQSEPPTQVSQPKDVPPQPPASNVDFLAGLQSQAAEDEEEGIPDWLANITGGTPKPAKVDPITETSGARWVEMGKKDDFAAQDSSTSDNEIPSWLADLQAQSPKADEKDELTNWLHGTEQAESHLQAGVFDTPSSKDETPDWLRSLGTDAASDDEATDWLNKLGAESSAASQGQPSTPSFGETSDWLSSLGTESNAASQEQASSSFGETPDWLSSLGTENNAASQAQPPAASSFDETPDWLSGLGAGSDAASQAQPSAASSSIETPDWLSQLGSESNAVGQPPAEPSFETPDWLNQLGTESSAASQAQPPSDSSFETPDWLSGLGGVAAEASGLSQDTFSEPASAESEAKASPGDLPSWLKEPEEAKKSDTTPAWLKKQQGGTGTDTPAWMAEDDTLRVVDLPGNEALPKEEPAQDDLLGDLPDWLKAAAPQSSIFDEPSAGGETPSEMPTWLGAAKPVETPPAGETPASADVNLPFETFPAFTTEDLSAENADTLFTEMPDWLSSAIEPPSSVPTPISSGDALSPSELPSWVEAMRPLEPAPSDSLAGLSRSDQTLESRGALAGLTGVLPLGTGFTPTSKPKAYSIKLNASEEQLRNAGILEQILAAETAPVPLESERTLSASRMLRWSFALILLIVAFTTAVLGSQFFATPQRVPNEISYTRAILEAVPDGAPVLVALDYEPSRVGEMEAVAVPVLDTFLLLKHPHLTFISSNESGSLLVERLLSGPLAERGYRSGETYQNLGYLPGGQLGIREFAQGPAAAAPLNISLLPAWTSGPARDVNSLQQFAAILLITDSPEAARTWVEQTQDLRGTIPFLVISSAQAAPMIQPYYASGQVQGMVSGLYGGAIYESQYNRPGAARNYWDAYSIGMLLAMSIVLGGGLVNLGLGLRDRSSSTKRETS